MHHTNLKAKGSFINNELINGEKHCLKGVWLSQKQVSTFLSLKNFSFTR